MSENSDTNLPIPIPLNIETITYDGKDRPKRSLSLCHIALALAKAQGEMENVEKDAKGNYGAYGTLAATWVAIRKPLSNNEIAIYQRPLKIDGKVSMCTMLLHSSGEFIDDSELEMIYDTSGRVTVMQAMGSAVTYSRRYTLQAATGVAPQDDDDGAAAGNPKPAPKENQRPTPAPKNQDTQKKPADTAAKEKETAAIVSPVNYILPTWGGSNKGKALGTLETDVLEKLRDHMKTQLTAKPKPKHVGEIATAYAFVKAVLADRTPPTPDDIPENLPSKPVHPEDESQPFPPDETEVPPTIDEFVIPKGVLAALDDIAGIPLKQISEKELRAAQKILSDEMGKGPKSKISAAAGFELRNKITEFFQSMGG